MQEFFQPTTSFHSEKSNPCKRKVTLVPFEGHYGDYRHQQPVAEQVSDGGLSQIVAVAFIHDSEDLEKFVTQEVEIPDELQLNSED